MAAAFWWVASDRDAGVDQILSDLGDSHAPPPLGEGDTERYELPVILLGYT
jgi:hypothetical protein